MNVNFVLYDLSMNVDLMRNPCRSMLRDERDSLSLYCLFHGSLKCSNERLDDLKLIETDITPSQKHKVAMDIENCFR